ncbi:MAG: dockerin type I domain-containing protein [Planctomycetota bacterium]
MSLRRPLRSESLESRRLLAAGLNLDDLLAEIPANVSPAQIESFEQIREAVDQQGLANPVEGLPLFAPLVYPGLRYGPDLVQEFGDRLFVVDQDHFRGEAGSLLVFQRDADDGLELIEAIKVGVHIDQMFVQDDQVVLIGSRFDYRILATDIANTTDVSQLRADWLGPVPRFPQTAAITIGLGDDVTVIRQELKGLSHEIHANEDQLVVVSTTSEPFYPVPTGSPEGEVWSTDLFPRPRIAGLVTTYQITPSGLQETDSTKIPLYGTTVLAGDDFYVASSQSQAINDLYPPASVADGVGQLGAVVSSDRLLPPTVSVSRYALGDEGIREVETIDLGSGYLMDFQVAEDGLTGIATFVDRFASEASTTLVLLDLSSETISIFDSIRLDGDYWRLETEGTDVAVLRNWRENALVIVDTDQSIDVDSQSRIRKVDLPEQLFVDYSQLRMGDDLVLRARARPSTPSGDDAATTQSAEPESILIVVSLSEARVVSSTPLPDGMRWGWHEDLFEIDQATRRFALVAWSNGDTNGDPSGDPNGGDTAESEWLPTPDLQFVFGRLDDSGEFQVDGAIPINDWREVDANAERLIVRTPNQLEEYDWQSVDEPVVTPLPRPVPPIEAIDDRLRLRDNGTDHTLHVLANDLIYSQTEVRQVEIVELQGAPDGAEIVNGRSVRLPAEALEGVDRITFDYVISDGEQTSQATVTIKVMPTRVNDPRDSTADGEVTAHDVLVVINFLAKYGSTDLDALPEKLGIQMPEFDEVIPAELDAMMRYDTDANGSITAHDALYVINQLGRIVGTSDSASDEDEDEERAFVGENPASIADRQRSDKI